MTITPAGNSGFALWGLTCYVETFAKTNISASYEQ